MVAANDGDLTKVKLLLDHGADIWAKNDEGKTAVDCAKFWIERDMDVPKYNKIVQLLEDEMSARVKARDK